MYRNAARKIVILCIVGSIFFFHSSVYILSTRIWEHFKIFEAFAALNDARMQYDSGVNATPQTRFYTNPTDTWGGAVNTIAGTANVGWVVSKESPTEDVTITGTLSTTGTLDIFCRNGATWTKDITIAGFSNANTRRFDIEFEKTSGIPMVLYSRNVITTNELGFRRKTGAGCGVAAWTAETTIDPTRITGTVLWVEMEARQTSGTNVMAAGFSDTSGAAGALDSLGNSKGLAFQDTFTSRRRLCQSVWSQVGLCRKQEKTDEAGSCSMGS